MRYVVIAIFCVLAAVLIAACGDDDDGEPTPEPTPQPTLEPGRRADVIDVVRSYVAEEGIEGETGDLTSPLDCHDLQDAAVQGTFCIAEPSVYAPAVSLVLVARADDLESQAWQLRLVFEDDTWQVVDVVRFEAD